MKLEELRMRASALGYELRRKGVKREKRMEKDANGKVIKNCYFPHLALTASGHARTWKMLDGAKVAFGFDKNQNGEVWEKKLLLGCEHIVRFINRNISDEELRIAINRLVSPLKKSEYSKRKK